MPYTPYVPTDWIDLTTLVDEARMDKMELGIKNATDAVIDLDTRVGAGDAASIESTATGDVAATNVQGAIAELASEKQASSAKGQANGYASLDAGAKVPTVQLPDLSGTYQAKTEKAQVNGYPSLDAGGKVPLAQLPAMSGGGVDYIGAWGAGTAYKKGDVVTYLGVDYLAVNDSTGQLPGAAAGSSSIGVALPASPVDGQRFTLVDSLTAPTYAWEFRYVAGIAGANKWIFIGGAPAYVTANGGSFTNTAFQDFASNASFTVPRAGDYLVSFGAAIYGSTPAEIYVTIKKGAAAALQGDAVSQQNIAATNHVISLARTIKAAGLAASDILKTQGRASASAITAQYLFMEITPVAVA